MLTSCNALYSCPKNNDVCCACQYAKSHRLPFSLCDFKATCPLALIHTNLWGPTLVVSTIGIRYFLLFVDDFSQFSWLYSLHTKGQALATFIRFKTLVENKFTSCIQYLQSNNGGGFKAFAPFLAQREIDNSCLCPITLAQDGRAKRKMRHIVETSLALLAITFLPLNLLYAFPTAIFLINRMPTKVLKLHSPFYVFFGKQPNYRQGFWLFLLSLYLSI